MLAIGIRRVLRAVEHDSHARQEDPTRGLKGREFTGGRLLDFGAACRPLAGATCAGGTLQPDIATSLARGAPQAAHARASTFNRNQKHMHPSSVSVLMKTL
jgi:hypothetical protein